MSSYACVHSEVPITHDRNIKAKRSDDRKAEFDVDFHFQVTSLQTLHQQDQLTIVDQTQALAEQEVSASQQALVLAEAIQKQASARDEMTTLRAKNKLLVDELTREVEALRVMTDARDGAEADAHRLELQLKGFEKRATAEEQQRVDVGSERRANQMKQAALSAEVERLKNKSAAV